MLLVEVTIYYHSLSLPARHFLGEVSAIHKERKTVDVQFKDGDHFTDVSIHLVKRYIYGDSCDEALDGEELTDTPGLHVSRCAKCAGKTYLSHNMGITTMTFAVPSDDYVPFSERIILTSAWSKERSGRILAGVVEDSISLKEVFKGVDSDMYTRAIW